MTLNTPTPFIVETLQDIFFRVIPLSSPISSYIFPPFLLLFFYVASCKSKGKVDVDDIKTVATLLKVQLEGQFPCKVLRLHFMSQSCGNYV